MVDLALMLRRRLKKATILDGVLPGGVGLINADDPRAVASADNIATTNDLIATLGLEEVLLDELGMIDAIKATEYTIDLCLMEGGNVIRNEEMDIDRALEDYLSAIALNPEYVQAMYNRGVVLGHVGRHQEAVAQFDKVIVLSPPLVGMIVALGALDPYSQEKL